MSETGGTPVVRLAELEIDSAQLDVYKTLLREEIAASFEREPGVRALYAVAIKGRPQHIRILEVHADQQAHESHLRAPHFLIYKAHTMGLIRSLNLVETDPIALGA